MYGPMDADRDDGELQGVLPEARPSILRRLSPAFLVIGITAGLGAGVPLAATQFLDVTYRAQAQISAGEGDRDHVATAIHDLQSRATLDNVIRALNLGRGDEFSANRPTVTKVISDVLSGDVTTVSEAEDAVRQRLRNAISVDYSADDQKIELDAVAANPAKAATLANRLADELRRLLATGSGPARDPQLDKMRAAADRADAALAGFAAKLDGDTRTRLKTFEDDRSSVEAGLGEAEQQVKDLTAKQALAASMTLSDVLTKPLPDSLEFTGLEYARQRYVQADLVLQQLSVTLGPLHPRRAAAQSVVDGARRDIGSALSKLSVSLKDEVASATTSLADLKNHQAALLADTQLNDISKQLTTLQNAADEARSNLEKLQASAPVSKPAVLALPPVLMPATAASVTRLGPDMTMLAGIGAATGLVIGLALSALGYRRQSRLADELDDMPIELEIPDADILPQRQQQAYPHVPAAMLVEPVIMQDMAQDEDADDRVIDIDHLLLEPGHGRPVAANDLVQDDDLEPRFAANDTTSFGDRMRSLLVEHQRLAEQADLPALLAAAVDHARRRLAEADGQSLVAAQLSETGHDIDELLEFQRELSELRELIRLHSTSDLKATG
ncbi:hypothetical protein [Neorhizobium sp. NCHU2750]|uniref:hypothetical protein n=1 Tax=Neorhizobium sp. NCHU2750 TaxID=1825976 RepID=UPI000E732AF9|nr:LPS biosynthesis protein [Neorhizobium sp. NCHU2750]